MSAASAPNDAADCIAFDTLRLDPREFGVQATAILGIKESGKSYTATALAERLYDAGVPFIAFDPMGIWRFLRVPGANRGGRGYPIVVAGGAAGDLPLTPQTAPAIVEAAIREGVSVVLDLFSIDLSKADWRRIVKDCATLLLHRNRDYGLRYVFIEEAAEFVPQVISDGEVFAAVEKLVRMGGNSRLGITLINPRSQEVNKAVLELCENVFLHRQRGKNAIENLEKWLAVAGADEAKAIIKSMPALPQGQCWAWIGGDNPQPPRLITVPRKASLHPDRRVMRGDEAAAPGKGAVDVGSFVAALQAALPKLAEEAAAADPKALRAEVARLKRDMAAIESKAAKGAGVSEALLKRAVDEAFKVGAASRDAEVAEARAAVVEAHARVFNETLERVRTSIGATIDGIAKRPPSAPCMRAPTRPATPVSARAPTQVVSASTPSAPRPLPKAAPIAATDALSKPQLKVLEAIAFFNALGFDMPTRAQIGAAAGYSPTGGGLGNLLGALRTMGFVEYPAPNCASFTSSGAAAAPPVDHSIPVRERLAGVLSTPQQTIIDALPRDGAPMSREDLGAATDYSPTGGGLGNLCGSLRSLGVVTYPQPGFVAVEPWVWH